MAELRSLYDAVPRIQEMIRSGAGRNAVDLARRARDKARVDGDLSDDAQVFVTLPGRPPSRRSSFEAINPDRLPLPDYTISFSDTSMDRLIEAARTVNRMFARIAPRSGSYEANRKGHTLSYRKEWNVMVNGRVVSIRDIRPETIRDTATIEFVSLVPHAGRLEYLNGDRLILGIARRVASQFAPDVVISSEWTSSDNYRRVFGDGQGGPSKGTGIYNLPAIRLGLAGRVNFAATFASSRTRRRRRRRRN